MFREKRQYGQEPTLVVKSKTKFREPLKWKNPALVFTCSWSDWFIEEADNGWRDEAWDIIRATPHLTYQILTKRIERAADHLPPDWPLKNVWLGVSVENQEYADRRIPPLLDIPATVRFLSVEPLIGAVDLVSWFDNIDRTRTGSLMRINDFEPDIDWVVAGGESGPDSRPSHPGWLRSLRDQCIEADVPFHFKQWGEWMPLPAGDASALEKLPRSAHVCLVKSDGRVIRPYSGLDAPGAQMVRVGKKAAGHLLDGREWLEFPREVSA